MNRRTFLGRLGGLTTAALSLTAGCQPLTKGSHRVLTNTANQTPPSSSTPGPERSHPGFAVAKGESQQSRSLPLTNGDEATYRNKIASYTKGLPHNERGEVDEAAYTALITALTTGQRAAYEAIPLGRKIKFANPQAAYALTLDGPDPQHVLMIAPPAFSSSETASEMVELYWQALTRDVPFAAYDTHERMTEAATDLSHCSDFHGPKTNGKVTPATLFRGLTSGDLIGPYLSQFLWLDVYQGSMTLTQRNRVPVANDDYMRTYPEWLNIQRGLTPARTTVLDQTPRYLRNNRDLGEYVHRDFTYQAFLNACLILLAMRTPLEADTPYWRSLTQDGFITFGPPHVLDCVARVASAALKASWYHKWLIHRRLRPEAFAGRVHNHLTKAASYPIHPDLLKATAPQAVFRTTGTYLLPMAYPEGCPTHPAYPAGHAAIAGACTTVLKAFFNEAFIIPNPVIASADGLSLTPYRGPSLTVGGELNKLASNIALARNAAGVHWRSDGIEGLKLGETVAIELLSTLRRTYPENYGTLRFIKFDGTSAVIG